MENLASDFFQRFFRQAEYFDKNKKAESIEKARKSSKKLDEVKTVEGNKSRKKNKKSRDMMRINRELKADNGAKSNEERKRKAEEGAVRSRVEKKSSAHLLQRKCLA